MGEFAVGFVAGGVIVGSLVTVAYLWWLIKNPPFG